MKNRQQFLNMILDQNDPGLVEAYRKAVHELLEHTNIDFMATEPKLPSKFQPEDEVRLRITGDMIWHVIGVKITESGGIYYDLSPDENEDIPRMIDAEESLLVSVNDGESK